MTPGLHTEVGANLENRGTIWAHQGDDDQPDPAVVRGQTPHRRLKPYYARHKRLHVMLSPDDMARLRRLAAGRQWSLTEWVRHAITLDESQRPTEAGQYRRKIVPEVVAIIGERLAMREYHNLMAEAEGQSDWQVKKALHDEAGLIADAAGWFTETRREIDRIRSRGEATPTGSTTGGSGPRTSAERTTASRPPRRADGSPPTPTPTAH